MLVQLIFLQSSFSSLAGSGCFNDGVSWTDDYLQDISPHLHYLQDINTLHIPTESACLDLCAKTAGCVAFTWLNSDYEDHHFAESCLTYTAIGEPEACNECTSGQLADCKPCSQPVECHISENLLAAVPASFEIECKEMCADTEGCGYCTWIENSIFLENICFLLSSCGETVECEGCSSGPPQCKTDHCSGIKYNLLDDPTRNEEHGK